MTTQRLLGLRENALLLSRNIVSAVVSESRAATGAAAAGSSSSSSSSHGHFDSHSLAFSTLGGATAVALYGPSLDDCIFFNSDHDLGPVARTKPQWLSSLTINPCHSSSSSSKTKKKN